MGRSSTGCWFGRSCQLELRQCDVVVELLEHNFHAATNLCLGKRSSQEIAGHKCARRVVELHDDRGVGHCRREALVAGVVHDRVGINRAYPAHWLELQIDADALHASRVWRMLEAAAALANFPPEASRSP